MKRFIILFLLFFLAFFQTNAQRLTYSPINQKLSELKVPENKSIIVFQSDLDLSFTSSMEKLESPIKKENFYYLIVSERVCIIKVINNVSTSEVELPFGQLSEKTLPIIKKGEYLIFKIEENNKELIVFNQTEIKKREGLNDNQMLYDKEALLILNVDPFDLEVELESSQPITAIKHSGKQYKVYIKPVKQEISVKQKGSDVQGIINIVQIDPKEVQYFYVSLPEHLRKREVIYDKNISVGDYLIESVPSGAVIEIFGNPSFNAEKNKTPYLLKGFETGFKVVTLILPEYETIKDTIQIGSSKKNKSSYNLVPQFAFINIKVEPQFPYSSLYVDNQNFYAKNETDIKIPVSSKEVEIRAQHFESEIFKINPSPGEVISITKTLKPILGKLFLECGENAEKGKVYVSYSKLNIEKKLIGTLPIKDTLILQEGQYDLIVEKEGYAMFKKPIQIEKNKIINEIVALGLTKKVLIITEPDNAAIYIDGNYVGKSNKKLNLSIGSHEIILVKEGYENHYESISVLSEIDSFVIYLNNNFSLYMVTGFGSDLWDKKIWTKPSSLPLLYIDDQYIGVLYSNHFDRKLPQLFSLNPESKHTIRIKINDNVQDFVRLDFSKDGSYYSYKLQNIDINYWFRINKLSGGLTGDAYKKSEIDTLNKIKKSFKIVINNHLNNSLSIKCDRKIKYFKKNNEKYILYLNSNSKKIQISENNTAFSRNFSFHQTYDLKHNEYFELNIYRDSTISNTTNLMNDINKKCNKEDTLMDFLVVNNSSKIMYFSIEGITILYSNFFTLLPHTHLELKLPEGLFRSVSMGGCTGPLDFRIDKNVIYKFSNKSYNNKFTIVTNAYVFCDPNNEGFVENINSNSNDSIKMREIGFLNLSSWIGYYYCNDKYRDVKINFEFIDSIVYAIFEFQENSINGIFMLKGIYDPTTNNLVLKPYKWIKQPENFRMVGFSGKFSSLNRFKGIIENNQCGTIFLQRKNDLLTD